MELYLPSSTSVAPTFDKSRISECGWDNSQLLDQALCLEMSGKPIAFEVFDLKIMFSTSKRNEHIFYSEILEFLSYSSFSLIVRKGMFCEFDGRDNP